MSADCRQNVGKIADLRSAFGENPRPTVQFMAGSGSSSQYLKASAVVRCEDFLKKDAGAPFRLLIPTYVQRSEQPTNIWRLSTSLHQRSRVPLPTYQRFKTKTHQLTIIYNCSTVVDASSLTAQQHNNNSHHDAPISSIFFRLVGSGHQLCRRCTPRNCRSRRR